MKGRYADLPDIFAGCDAEPVDWHAYAHVFSESVEWPETKHPDEFDWFLIRAVPVHRFGPMTRESWRNDPDLDDDEMDMNEFRYDEIYNILFYHEDEAWPVVVDSRGFVLDGYHRLACMNDLSIKTVDVLYPRER